MRRTKPEPPKQQKIQKHKEPKKSIIFKDNKICSLNDIEQCLTTLTIDNCPIVSLSRLNNFESIKNFQVKNSPIFSFKDANLPKKIETISFEGCPISRYPLYRLMVLLYFIEANPKLKTIDSDPITEEEKSRAKNCLNTFSALKISESSLLHSYLKNGGIIRTINDLSPNEIRRKMQPNITMPIKFENSPINSLSYSPFFTKKSFDNQINSKSQQLSKTSLEKKMCDLNNELRSCQLEFDRIFACSYDKASLQILPLYQQILNIYEKVNLIIKKVSEINKDNSQEYKIANEFLTAIASILKEYENSKDGLKKYLSYQLSLYQESIQIINNSKISEFCQDYVEFLNQLIPIIKDILNPLNFSLDYAISNIPKISEIKSNFTSPYVKIMDIVHEFSESLFEKYKSTPIGGIVTHFRQKVLLYKRMPLLNHFDSVIEQLAMIRFCFGEAENEDTHSIAKISYFCQCVLDPDDQIFRVYAKRTPPDAIVRSVMECGRAFVLSCISFWKNSNFVPQIPAVSEIDNTNYERSKVAEKFIVDFDKYIEENNVVTSSIKDRIFDFSNDKAHNVYISSILNLKKEEINMKNLKIQKLKELIAMKKSAQ